MKAASANDFFDEIILALRGREMDNPQEYISKEVLLEFYRGVVRTQGGEPPRYSSPPVGGIRVSPSSTNGGIPPAPASVSTIAPAGDLTFSSPEEMSWEELEKSVSCCTKCVLCRERKNTVFGQGKHPCDLMFIGEGPGADEDEQGLPFVGKAGELLTKMILAMQFTREDVYIGNIVKCRPPGNRNPEEGEMEKCLPYIKRQIQLVSPKVIVLLGAVPLKALFGISGITRNRGKFLDYNGIPAMPTYHPAFLLRNPAAKREVWNDLQCVMKLLGKAPH